MRGETLFSDVSVMNWFLTTLFRRNRLLSLGDRGIEKSETAIGLGLPDSLELSISSTAICGSINGYETLFSEDFIIKLLIKSLCRNFSAWFVIFIYCKATLLCRFFLSYLPKGSAYAMESSLLLLPMIESEAESEEVLSNDSPISLITS